ncbi:MULTISPECIES: (2Fe-2S)-binding protein [Amycolatopsis]|uniref:Carbon-monoxide dehydrogenase small subunit n=1 Tax=Amycolatopsis echigonensis TaxID=2576905 RepID=A0A2N3WNP0_9PSEU|nr:MULTISPECIES: (2Fe-2S)-binding protein [Amycolatopsis]PKV95488.1 carbon-monoxide dehydrogenase small subunit [Amycolatopsis niigatensis]
MTTKAQPAEHLDVTIRVNGRETTTRVAARDSLADHLRDQLGLTGTKLGCEHGVCGACTVLLDDKPVRSCLMLAAQADGHELRTVEGLAGRSSLSPLQESFRRQHALQCGFCTAGFLMSATALLEHNPRPTREEVVDGLSGCLCRCTGYEKIVEAVLDAAHGNANEVGQ